MSLLLRINRFLRATHMPPTRFGRLAVNDPRLVSDLRRGRRVSLATARRVEAFIARGQA
jgi:hypothetical protein